MLVCKIIFKFSRVLILGCQFVSGTGVRCGFLLEISLSVFHVLVGQAAVCCHGVLFTIE